MYSCTFIGHHDCPDDIKNLLYNTIKNLIINENVSTFFIGTQGRFDRLAYEMLCTLKKHYNIEIIIVLAYINISCEDLYYDMSKTIFPDILEKTPLRFAIHKRNIYMIENSQFMICYMDNSFSNTYNFVKKARNKKLSIINLGKFDINNII